MSATRQQSCQGGLGSFTSAVLRRHARTRTLCIQVDCLRALAPGLAVPGEHTVRTFLADACAIYKVAAVLNG